MAFDGTREPIAVGRNKDGYCQTVAYGPLGSARKSFRALCAEKGLPIKIGKTATKKEITMSKSIEYPPIEDLMLEDMWDGLDFPAVNFPLSRDAVIAGLSAGGGMLLTSAVVPKLTFLKDKMWRSVASILGGLAGGYLLYDFNRPAAAGLMAGMVGHGVATIAGDFTNVKVSLEDDYSDEDLLGLGDAVVDEETLLTGGVGQDEDEELFGLEDAEVDPVPPYELTSLF